MQLSRKALDAYNAAIKQQGDNAEKAAGRAIDAWFGENPDASIAETREFCTALMNEVGTVYGNGAGDAAYALRALMADAAGVDLPDIDYVYAPDREYVQKTARYQAGKLKDGNVEGFKKSIADAARYFAERGANDTMANLGKADARKLGNRVRFARVPTGATTCPYCLMLASRGFVYRSGLTALNANHRHCDCRIVEGFDGMELEGYDPDEYYDMWKHPEKYEEERIAARNSGWSDPIWSNPIVESLESADYLRAYIVEKHELNVIGEASFETYRAVAAGLDEAAARFGTGAAVNLRFDSGIRDFGQYRDASGTIVINQKKPGGFLTAMHEYVHSIDAEKSMRMAKGAGQVRYNAYSTKLAKQACKELGIPYGGKAYRDYLASMAGMNPVFRKALDDPSELLAYSVERERISLGNELTSALVHLFEEDR